MGKLTEDEYSYLFDELKGHSNPWLVGGYNDPAKIKREWRKEVNCWRKALEVVALARWELE